MTRRASVVVPIVGVLVALLLAMLSAREDEGVAIDSVPAQATSYGRLVIGDIQVDVAVSNHNLALSNSMTVGGGGGGGAGKVEFQPLVVKKTIDKATPVIMNAVASGKLFPEATLTVFRPNSTNKLVTYELGEVWISAQSHGGNKAGAETLNLGYARLSITAGGQKACWDLAQAKGC